MAGWGLVVVLGGCLAGRQHLLPGFGLGFLASISYYLLLSLRVRKLVDVPPEKTAAYMRMGWIVRLSLIILVLILALNMPGIDFLSTVIGLFSFQFVMVVQTILLVAAELRKVRAGLNKKS